MLRWLRQPTIKLLIKSENNAFKLFKPAPPHYSLRSVMNEIFVVLSKDFDLVNHDTLFKKLGFYGIIRTSFSLMRPYLEIRRQKVAIENADGNMHLLEWETITRGVPQYSVVPNNDYLTYLNRYSGIILHNSLQNYIKIV